jgi:arabinan endo-1,5-alpha-L-arabinosidase
MALLRSPGTRDLWAPDISYARGEYRLYYAYSLWLGPGGESILLRQHELDLIVFHAYDHVTGKPSLQISTIAWKDGWPSAALLDR